MKTNNVIRRFDSAKYSNLVVSFVRIVGEEFLVMSSSCIPYPSCPARDNVFPGKCFHKRDPERPIEGWVNEGLTLVLFLVLGHPPDLAAIVFGL